MEGKGIIAKSEKILLAVTAAFLCVLLGLFFHDRAALSVPGVAVEEGAEAPQETFLPDVTPLDINAAGEEELTALPGIGPVLARRIVEYRAEHGPFASVEDLTDVSGFGASMLAALVGVVTAETPGAAG